MVLKNLKAKTISIYILMFLFCSNAFGQSYEMGEALDLLNAEEYAMAEKVYKSILENNQYSAELYYNLGMANYYQEDIGEAVLYLEKALKYKPNFKSAKTNLNQLKSEMTDSVYELEPFFLQRFWTGFINVFPIIVWRILSLGFLLGCLYGMYHWLLGNDISVKRNGFLLMLILFVMFLLSSGAFYSRGKILSDNPYAVVTQKRPFFEGPNELSEVEGKYIPAGTKVLKLESYAEWIKVRLPDAEHAYLRSNMMQGI